MTDYLFHGRTPNDWVSGGNDGHRYTILFAAAPSETQRLAIATAVETLLARGPVQSGSAWSWADRWASFTVGERWHAGDAFFARMAELVRAIHAIAPLVQVRYANAIEPETPGLIAAPADGWAPDAAFEATRKELIGASIRRQGARVAAAALEAGEIALVPLTEDVPYPKAVTPTSSVQFGTHDPIVVGKSGRIVAATYGAVGRKYPLYYVDDADQPRIVELAVHDIRAFAVSDDGARVLIGASPVGPGVDSLYEVTLATGESRLIWSSPSEKIRGLSWVGDRVFVMTDKKLYWLRVETGEQIATVAAGGMWLRSLRDGCVQTIYNSSNKLFVIGAAGDKLKILAKLATPGGVTIVETPDAIQAFVLAGGRSTAFELLNVDEAYRAFADKAKPKKRASPRT